MTLNWPIAQITLFERGAILAVQVIWGWDRLRKLRLGIPMLRTDVAVCYSMQFGMWEDDCGCTMARLGPLGLSWGRH